MATNGPLELLYLIGITLGVFSGLVPFCIGCLFGYSHFDDFEFSIYFSYLLLIVFTALVLGTTTAFTLSNVTEVNLLRIIVAQLWFMSFTITVGLIPATLFIGDGLRDRITYVSIGTASIGVGIIIPLFFGAPMVSAILATPSLFGLEGGSGFFLLLASLGLSGGLLGSIINRKYGTIKDLAVSIQKYQENSNPR